MTYLEFVTIVGLLCLLASNQNRIAGQFGLGSDAAREPYQRAARRWSVLAVIVLAVGGSIGILALAVGAVQ